MVSTATNWLDTCMQQHQTCVVTQSESMPRRLLDVRKGISKPCLVETHSKTLQYATLSYCWGKSPDILVTTRDNIEQHRHHIPITLLAQVRQDVQVRYTNLPF